jgi:hypothetical protein
LAIKVRILFEKRGKDKPDSKIFVYTFAVALYSFFKNHKAHALNLCPCILELVKLTREEGISTLDLPAPA